jgi:hypothetical protein
MGLYPIDTGINTRVLTTGASVLLRWVRQSRTDNFIKDAGFAFQTLSWHFLTSFFDRSQNLRFNARNNDEIELASAFDD